MIRKFYLTLPLFLFFTACQNKSDIYVENTLYKTKPLVVDKEATLEYEPIINPKEYKELLEEDDTLSKNDAIDMNKQFMDFYNEWKHVKYRFGGNSKKGIDCSAFTQRIYKEKFDIKIPRSTRTQVKVGTEVANLSLN